MLISLLSLITATSRFFARILRIEELGFSVVLKFKPSTSIFTKYIVSILEASMGAYAFVNALKIYPT